MRRYGIFVGNQSQLSNERGNVHITHSEARSRNYFCRRKAISITYYEYVFVALVIHHVKHTRRVINCGLPDSTVSLKIFS
jgi:hypothetical protein